MNLIVDEGNTRVKLAVFQGERVLEVFSEEKKDTQKKIEKILKKYDLEAVMISSVTDEVKKITDSLSIKQSYYLSSATPIPFSNHYKTPTTLGVDRIGLITQAYTAYPNENVLVIDAGTCITYDFINNKGEYLGGAIAPGLEMKYKAMHAFTGKLPLIKENDLEVPLIGTSTMSCMQSGVINGTVFEIDATILAYQQRYNNLKVILTGGDSNMLCKQLKNTIFANPNFLLEGLNSLLMYQLKND